MTYITDFYKENLQMKDMSNGRTFELVVEHVLDDTALVSYMYGASGKKYTFSINRYLDVVASSANGLKNFVVSVAPEEKFTVKNVVVTYGGVVNTVELLRNVSKATAKAQLKSGGRSCFAVDTKTRNVYTKETI